MSTHASDHDSVNAPPPSLPPTPTAPAAEPRTFEEMGLRPEVMRALSEMGFLEPMPVQSAVFPRMVGGRDVMVQSRTGSGKTAAFGIPFAQGLVDPATPRVQALCLAPTRELALQVAQECGKIGQHRGLTVVPIYGGAPMGKQVEMLKAGAQIVAGTPGRVLDHLRRGTLRLDALKVLVLDEADEMLSMGFLEEITEIIRQCPTDRQTTLFSATIPPDIERIGSRYMRDPEKVQLSGDGVGAREIHHAYYLVSGMGRTRDLERVIEVERPETAIIFCNTREDTNVVAEFLRKRGLDAEAISSDLTQADRERVMGRMKDKNLRFLVATDIAARGIDISDLSHVINYTFPESAEVYVHRTGRTGRAGKKGTAISLIAPRELGNFYMLKLTYRIKPEERTLPSDDQWKVVNEGRKVDELRAQMGDRQVSAEWCAVARRLWASEDGERIVAALVQDRLSPERQQQAAPRADATAIAHQPAELRGEAPSPEAPRAPESEPRSRRRRADPRGERGRGERAERTPRGERAERPARAGRSDRSPEQRAERSDRSPEQRAEGDRGRRREAQPAAAPISGTIDTSDGREFWEAWVDSRTEATPAEEAPRREPAQDRETASAEPAEGRRRERRERTPEPELAPGQVRLYLNLGRRDGMREADVEAFLRERSVSVPTIQVRSSHTYLIVPEADEAEVCHALNGARRGDRDIVCERARK